MRENPDDFFRGLEKYKNETFDDLPLHPTLVKPEWYDARLFAQGQRFTQRNFSNVFMGELVSLCALLALPDILDPLIYTRRSDTLEAATKRYYETTLRVKSWFESDPWDRTSEAYRNIVMVRFLHSSNGRKLNSKGKPAVAKAVEPIKAAWGGGCPVTYLDWTGQRPSMSSKLEFLLKSDKYITQPEMTVTLFTMMGLPLLFPEKLGIFDATDDDLMGFVHYWRCIGHLIGINDDINLCRGSLSEVKAKCDAYLNLAVIPCLYNLNANWVHMSKCLLMGNRTFLYVVDYEILVLYLFWLLDLKCDEFKKTVSTWSIVKFNVFFVAFRHFFRIPGVKFVVNSAVHFALWLFKHTGFTKLKNIQSGSPSHVAL